MKFKNMEKLKSVHTQVQKIFFFFCIVSVLGMGGTVVAPDFHNTRPIVTNFGIFFLSCRGFACLTHRVAKLSQSRYFNIMPWHYVTGTGLSPEKSLFRFENKQCMGCCLIFIFYYSMTKQKRRTCLYSNVQYN